MATDPSTKPGQDTRTSTTGTPWHVKSGRFLVEADYLWQAIGCAILGVVGLGALVVAIVEFNLLALAFALVALPLVAVVWLAARALRDAQREM